jgi:hypothetical protein
VNSPELNDFWKDFVIWGLRLSDEWSKCPGLPGIAASVFQYGRSAFRGLRALAGFFRLQTLVDFFPMYWSVTWSVYSDTYLVALAGKNCHGNLIADQKTLSTTSA